MLIRRLGSDPEKIFPYEALMDQFKKFGAYAAFVALLLFPVIFSDPETLPFVNGFSIADASKWFIIPNEFKKKYNKLVVGLFDDLVKYGYI